MQLGSGTWGSPPQVGGGPPADAAGAPEPPAVGQPLVLVAEAKSSAWCAPGARAATDPKWPQDPLRAPRTTPRPRANAAWKPMRRGLRPAAGPTSICGVNVEPTAVVDLGPAAAADRQGPAMGTCAPVPAAACPERGAQRGPCWTRLALPSCVP